MNNPYHCIKLKTGETLFAEIIGIDDANSSVTVINPMLIENHDNNVSIVPWLPYVEDTKIQLPIVMMFFSSPLNKQFFEYYGQVVIQSELNRIKQRVYETMQNRSDSVTIAAGFHEMKKMSEELSKKFGIPGPDFSEFEEVLSSASSDIVLH